MILPKTEIILLLILFVYSKNTDIIYIDSNILAADFNVYFPKDESMSLISSLIEF